MYALVLAVALAQNTPTIAPAATPVPSGSPATLQVSTTTINLNPAQQQIVTVTGATPPLQILLDRKLVTATADPSGTALTIAAAQATGSATLHVTDATGARADIAIRVAFNAGTIVGQTTLTVTGNPAEPAWLAQEVADRVTHVTQALPVAKPRMRYQVLRLCNPCASVIQQSFVAQAMSPARQPCRRMGTPDLPTATEELHCDGGCHRDTDNPHHSFSTHSVVACRQPN